MLPRFAIWKDASMHRVEMSVTLLPVFCSLRCFNGGIGPTVNLRIYSRGIFFFSPPIFGTVFSIFIDFLKIRFSRVTRRLLTGAAAA